MAVELKELVIDRKRWGYGRLRIPNKDVGRGINEYGLYSRAGETVPPTDVGKMCCLGFAAEACGVDLATLAETRQLGYPSDLPGEEQAKLPAWLVADAGIENDGWMDTRTLSRINDCDPTAPGYATREEEIIAIFAKHGTTVTFVGEP